MGRPRSFTSWALGLLVLPSPPPMPFQSPVPACFPPTTNLTDFQVRWYCSHLQAAGESVLAAGKKYRFTYIPSFHPPRVVVISREQQGWVATGKVLSGQGGYAAGKVVRSTRRLLTTDQVRLLEQRLENAGLWEPTDAQQDGVDGSEWLLEARDGERYTFHDVWSPTESTFPQYRKVCVYMLELAGIVPDGEEHALY